MRIIDQRVCLVCHRWRMPKSIVIAVLLATVIAVSRGQDIDLSGDSHYLRRQALNGRKERLLSDEPIQLVKPDADHKSLVVVEENLKLLNYIKASVAVVAVVGNFHSGKSFLMNQLMQKKTGFGVGPSVQPKTMGIWMWGQPARMTNSQGEDINVIFLDTEGFAANNISENYDAKVFAVSTILSSHLLFNSVKIINQADIDYLEVLARKTQLFALRSQMSKSMWVKDFSLDLLVFPPLTWIVQDFFQDLEEADNPREWLHRLMRTHTRETEEYKISLLDIFREIDCHTLFIPATKKHLLTDLSRAREEDLTPEYREERDLLIEKLSGNLHPKRKKEKLISGAELGHLLRILVVAANEGNLASVPSRWEAFVDHLQSTATEDCLKFYEDEMTNILSSQGVDGIMKTSRLDSFHRQMNEKAQELMSHLLQGLSETREAGLVKLTNRIDLTYERLKDLNDKKIQLKLNDVQHSNEIGLEEELGSLKFPLPSYTFESESQTVLTTRKDTLYSFALQLTEDDAARSFVSQALQSLVRIVEMYRLKNTESIRQFFLETVKLAITHFDEMLKKNWDRSSPLKPSILDKLKDQAGQESLLLFTEEARDFESESVYSVMRSHLRDQMEEVKERLHEENGRLAGQFIQSHASEILSLLKQRTGPDMIRMPAFDDDLEQKLEQEVNQAIKAFETATIDFTIYESFSTHYQSFKEGIVSMSDLRRKENIEAFTRVVYKPLESALKMIVIAESKYTTVFSFRQFIRSVCLINLDDGEPKTWPLDLKMQVIDNFINSREELLDLIRKKDGLWSLVWGFFEWIAWTLQEYFLDWTS